MSPFKWNIEIEVVSKYGADETVWCSETGRERKLEKAA
jgi:hypothetical protein